MVAFCDCHAGNGYVFTAGNPVLITGRLSNINTSTFLAVDRVLSGYTIEFCKWRLAWKWTSINLGSPVSVSRLTDFSALQFQIGHGPRSQLVWAKGVQMVRGIRGMGQGNCGLSDWTPGGSWEGSHCCWIRAVLKIGSVAVLFLFDQNSCISSISSLPFASCYGRVGNWTEELRNRLRWFCSRVSLPNHGQHRQNMNLRLVISILLLDSFLTCCLDFLKGWEKPGGAGLKAIQARIALSILKLWYPTRCLIWCMDLRKGKVSDCQKNAFLVAFTTVLQ